MKQWRSVGGAEGALAPGAEFWGAQKFAGRKKKETRYERFTTLMHAVSGMGVNLIIFPVFPTLGRSRNSGVFRASHKFVSARNHGTRNEVPGHG